MTAILREQGVRPTQDGRLNPAALAGIASDGRALPSLLDTAPYTALSRIGAGASLAEALLSGWAVLAMLAATQVADAGRAADATATAVIGDVWFSSGLVGG